MNQVIKKIQSAADALSAICAAYISFAKVNGIIESIKAPRARFDVECRDAQGNLKWSTVAYNLVTTQGKNDLLDKYLSGSAYTASWFCGLISSVGYTAIAAADTMASHAGWTEAGGTNAPTYTGNRPAITFAAASGASKSSSGGLSFTFTGAGTVKGMFATTVNTKDGTTGLLYNAVLFTGGDRVVVNTDVVNVTVTYTA